MEEDLQNRPAEPVQPQVTETKPKNRKRIVLLVSICLLFLLGFLITMIVWNGKNRSFSGKPKEQVRIQQTSSLIEKIKRLSSSGETVAIKRMVYVSIGKMYSYDPQSGNAIDLSKLYPKMEIGFGSPMINKDGSKMFFVQERNIYFGNTDGTVIKQLTKNKPSGADFGITLDKISDDGDSLLFKYIDTPGMGDALPRNKEIKYGMHLLNSSGDNIFINETGQDSFYFEGNYLDLISWQKEQPLFLDKQNGTLYQSEVPFKNFKKVGAPLPKVCGLCKEDVNEENSLIAYVSANEGKSQVMLKDYNSGERIEISPVGGEIEYNLSVPVSPNWRCILYNHNVWEKDSGGTVRKLKAELYSYDVLTKNTVLLDSVENLFYGGEKNRPVILPEKWLRNDIFIYNEIEIESGKSNYYTYNLSTGLKEKFMEKTGDAVSVSPKASPTIANIDDETRVRDLISAFENGIKDKDVNTLMSMFTPAETKEEKEAYRSLMGLEPKVENPRLFNNVSSNFIVTNWQIARREYPDNKELITKDNNTYFVTVDETRKSWCNADPCAGTYSFENTSPYIFEVVNVNSQWMVNKYYLMNQGNTRNGGSKYEALGF